MAVLRVTVPAAIANGIADLDLTTFELRIKTEVRHWCDEHLSAMPKWGNEVEEDSFFLDFSSDADMLAFVMRWS